jgi:pimeloyl-ACP methyl ester carboxylesterase
MFSETRYALNGDLRVAYRASREGPRDIVFIPNWFTCCEHLPELPSLQGWVEAMTSLGRLIFFDQPGTGASDPVTTGALPTLEQWADSITAVLDDLDSHEAVLLASVDGAFAPAALFAATHPFAPPRWSCSTVTQMRAAPRSFKTKPKLRLSACGAAGRPNIW